MLQKVFCLILFIGIFSFVSVMKGSPKSIKDTTFQIKEISISSGIKVRSNEQKFDLYQLQQVEKNNVGTLLSRYSSIYVKSDAGGVSSIHFRGTSSSQTSVFWGGLDLNSRTLGSSNFTNIPVFLFDRISIVSGASAENGSGTIGGIVNLDLTDRRTQGLEAEVAGLVGSFGEYMQGVKVFAGNDKWEWATRYYHYEKANNFSFKNRFDYNFDTNSYNQDIQKFSAINNQGLIQQFKYRFDYKKSLSAMVWIEDDWHQQQPTMSANSSESLNASVLKENNQRVWVEFNNNRRVLEFKIAGGYVHDRMDDWGTNTTISTQRWLGKVDVERRFWKDAKYKAGIDLQHIIPNVYAYSDNITEQRFDTYASIYKGFSRSRGNFSLNLRKQWVSDFNTPFTPSLDLNYFIYNSNENTWKAVANVSKSYRVPTLNDRFWGGGNVDLKPEDGVNYESGLSYSHSGDVSLKFQAKYFYMNVKDWILWVQGASGYEGKNVQRVVSKGLELQGSMYSKISNNHLSLNWTATYNSAQRKESVNTTDAINQQLEYSPKYMGNISMDWTNKNFGATSDLSYVYKRYYDQLSQLPSYMLWNLGVYYSLRSKSIPIRFSLQLLNVLNTNYENQFGYAMPGRGFQLSFTCYLTKSYIFNK